MPSGLEGTWRNDEIADRRGGAKDQRVTDLTALYIKLKTEERRLHALYEEFGKATYKHFTSDEEQGAEKMAKYVEAITLQRQQILQIRKTIQKKREE